MHQIGRMYKNTVLYKELPLDSVQYLTGSYTDDTYTNISSDSINI